MSIIYVLTNVCMPGLVKIGCTTDSVEERIKQLSQGSGIPLPFVCHFAAKVENYEQKEKILHALFADQRINPKREFFRIDPEKVVLAISMGRHEPVHATPTVHADTPEEQEAVDKETAKDTVRRSRISLAALGIKEGDELVLSRGNGIHAIVAANNQILYNDKIMSLSAAALEALHGLGYTTPAASGSDYWMYESEILDEIRRRKEEAAFSDET